MPQKKIIPIKINYLLIVLLLFSFTGFAQKTIIGKVISDSSKQPLAGATVQVKGTNIAAATNSDGSFSINVPKSNSSLLISWI